MDERQRIVFDGALSHVSGSGRGLFNHRFGMATLCATHHENVLTPSESFPFTTVPQTDPVTGRSGDILARARQRGHVPKIIFTQTSTEYWTRGASLLHTDVAGTQDVENTAPEISSLASPLPWRLTRKGKRFSFSA